MATVLLALALLVTGCSRGGSENAGTTAGPGDFGDLKGICHPGKATGAPAQGVTAGQIRVGVFTDAGFTKDPEFVDTAKVFTSWCNAHGGIGGRELVADIHDAKLMEVRQRMLDACRDDFALVAGSAALDGLGVKDRLSCLLPDFPAQVDQVQNSGSDLQVGGGANAAGLYDSYTGFHQWLFKERYPSSANAIGLINGDTPITRVIGQEFAEALPVEGAKIVYNDLYPAMGVPDWTPYAQAIKEKNVKGLIFLGDFRSLAKLEDVLSGMDYRLDWIDSNSNSYTSAFLQLAGASLSAQHNYASLGSTAPLESASTVPVIQQAKAMFAQYAPGEDLTFPALRALSQWALFAKAAGSCGDALTRKCVYQAAIAEHAWTGGGLLAPADLAPASTVVQNCFNVVEATPQGWRIPDFAPDHGLFRCDIGPYRFTGDYGRPMTLADVGKSMSDFR
ncbi:ABC transporter substrate-binding protein [Nocardia sp. alder85J]|uniref:ABC transporter substrate-binding protein n=1 Tax=Nocardia sp. alder85J TaxID=2862949 RepID=UPI001CD577C0|nr:ABC transporter substrate-binding protein [Nocardia sp. alder85J]MCX4091092.1 ABC transporter substrate-binding protein [Nocardia sp. alder85J]